MNTQETFVAGVRGALNHYRGLLLEDRRADVREYERQVEQTVSYPLPDRSLELKRAYYGKVKAAELKAQALIRKAPVRRSLQDTYENGWDAFMCGY